MIEKTAFDAFFYVIIYKQFISPTSLLKELMMKYFTFQWHITEACDQRCSHCYIYSDKSHIFTPDLSLKELEKILDNCEDMCSRLHRLPYFSITGGDPILYKFFWEFLELLHNRKIAFNILGNPFHLTDEVCQRLHTLGCKKYQLSIDGLLQTHDMIRRPGSFKSTLDAIPIIRNAGISCAVMTTVSKTNIHEIPAIIDLVVKNNVDIFAFARYCSTDSSWELMVSPTEYRSLLETCWDRFHLYQDSGTSFNLKDHLWTLFLYEKGLFTPDKSLDPNVIYEGCSCGINHMTILSDGTVYACRRMESPIGNALRDSLYDVFLSDKMDDYRQYEQFQKCSKCELLRFCRGCPATACGIYGNMYAPDPQCWKIINE